MSADGARYFIGIGCPTAPDIGASPLEAVENDVRRMADFFTGPHQGYVRVLADDIPIGAPASHILDHLTAWFGAPDRREDDIVVLYWAGHGDEAGPSRNHYLFTSDSVPTRLASTAIKTASLSDILFERDGPSPQSVLLIVDTCYSQRGAGQAIVAAAIAQSALSGGGAGLSVIASAGVNDQADDGPFVTAFLETVADRSRYGAGAAPFISPQEIATAVNDVLDYQRAAANVLGATQLPRFIRAPASPPYPGGALLEDVQHWELRGRGIDDEAMKADFFVGRAAVLDELKGWLRGAGTDQRGRVVTGAPGSGKSAVLARIVLDLRREPTPPIAIHARGQTLAGLVETLARSADVAAATPTELLGSLRATGGERRLIVDALDEAAEPRAIEEQLLGPLAALDGVRLVIGSRRIAGRVPLGTDGVEIDLDLPTYFSGSDVAAYALARLVFSGFGALLSAPARAGQAKALAREIARLGGHSFLYARIVSRLLATTLTAADLDRPDWLAGIAMPKAATDAFGDDLRRFDDVTRRRIVDLLVPLAYAQGRGLPQKDLWHRLASAISGRLYGNGDIRDLKEQAGYYLIRDNEDGETVYRLFHEELARFLRDRTLDERVDDTIFEALVARAKKATGAEVDWGRLQEPYILSHLAHHAERSGHLDVLLDDAGFLVHAAPRNLLIALRRFVGHGQTAVAAYFGAYAAMRDGDVAARIEALALSAAHMKADALVAKLSALRDRCRVFPVRIWQDAPASNFLASTGRVSALHAVRLRSGEWRAVVIGESTITVHELLDGKVVARYEIQESSVRCTAAGVIEDEIIVVVADGRNLRVCNISQGVAVRSIVRSEPIEELSIGEVDGKLTLFVGGTGGSLDAFELPALAPVASRPAHAGGIVSLAFAKRRDGTPLLASGSIPPRRHGSLNGRADVRLWNAATLSPLGEFAVPDKESVENCFLVEVGGQTHLFLTTAYGGMARLIDIATGAKLDESKLPTVNLFGHLAVGATSIIVSGFGSEVRLIEVRADRDGTPRIAVLPSLGITGGIWANPAEVNGKPVLLGAGETAGLRVWDLDGIRSRSMRGTEPKLGLVVPEGEPLFRMGTSPDGRYFATLSRYGNKRICDHGGQELQLRRVVTALEDPAINDFEWIWLKNDGEDLIEVTGGKSGVFRTSTLAGRELFPKLALAEITVAEVAEVDGDIVVFAALKVENTYGAHALVAYDLRTGQPARFASADGVVARWDDRRIMHLAVGTGQPEPLIVLGDRSEREISVVGGRSGRELWSRPVADIASLHVWNFAGTELAAAGLDDGRIFVFDLASGERKAILGPHAGAVAHLGTAGRKEEGLYLVSATANGELAVWSGDDRPSFGSELNARVNRIAGLADNRIAVLTELGFMILELCKLQPSRAAAG